VAGSFQAKGCKGQLLMAKYTIEIDGPRNERVIFAPTQSFPPLRGRWKAHAVAGRGKSPAMNALSSVEFIPGICVELDTSKKQGRTFDPLRETDEGRRIWRTVKSILVDQKQDFGSGHEPWQTAVHERLDADAIKLWLWHMVQLVESGLARVVSGSDRLPSVDDVRAMPGRRRKDPMNTAYQVKGEAEEDKWVDVVPERGGKGDLAGVGAPSGGGTGDKK
jgi:hypothetical protein